MAQNPITLEEAAERLGLEPNEFKRLLKTDPAFKVLSQIRDGSNVRFKPSQIEELARNLGAASDPGLPLADIAEDGPLGSDDFKLHGSSDSGTPVEQPLEFGSTDDDIFSLSADAPKKGGKPDSDVRLEPAGGKKKPDSDVRLEGKGKGGKDAAVVPTEEMSVDFSGPGSAVIKGGSSAKLSAPKSSGKIKSGDSGGKGLSKPGTGDSSEFELSLDADSDDFELQLNTDTSDEVDLGSMPQIGKPGSKPKAGESGINLRDPADSGISLEKKKGKKPPAADDDSDDFELSLDSGSGASSAKLTGPKSGRTNKPEPVTSDSDSEFELTLDDSGGSSSLEHAALEAEEGDKNDIFETDFEIPPMSDESGSEAVALESDTDLESSDEMALNESDVVSEDDTGSQVVMLEDDEAVAVDESVDLADVQEEEEGIGAALKGVKGRRRHDEDEEEEPVTVGTARPAPWGVWPSVFLFPAFVLVIIGGLIGFELVHSMWGYQQPKKPSTPIVRGIAKTLDMEVKD